MKIYRSNGEKKTVEHPENEFQLTRMGTLNGYS